MAKFNPNKIEAFRDFLDLQTSLKNAQKSYDDAKRVEQVTDAIMTMGIEAGAAAQKHYIRSRNRKRLLVGLVIAGGAYLYKKMKDKEKETYAK
jgi:predicted peroxiredoxin